VQTSQGIEFNAVKKMRYFSEIGRGIPSAVCQLKTKDSWLYGIFVVSAKLPKGTHLWPAIWLCGKEHWPPEIDAIEAYSRNTTDYDRYKTLQSNVHFVKDNSPAMVRSVNHCLPNDVTNEFIEYTIW
jgi:beta-glucanase (GH16 family)